MSAFEFLAAEYGWTAAYVRANVTTEQLIRVYLDGATDRIRRTAGTAFDNAVEATRMGAIFATSRRAYDRWRSRARRSDGSGRKPGLTGARLEAAIASLAMTHPDLVAIRSG